jgi:hypothetical protein
VTTKLPVLTPGHSEFAPKAYTTQALGSACSFSSETNRSRGASLAGACAFKTLEGAAHTHANVDASSIRPHQFLLWPGPLRIEPASGITGPCHPAWVGERYFAIQSR